MGLKRTILTLAVFTFLVVLEGELIAGWSFGQTNFPKPIWLLFMICLDIVGIIAIWFIVGVINVDFHWIQKKFKLRNLLIVIVIGFIIGVCSELIGSTYLWTYSEETTILIFGVNARAVAHWMLYPVLVMCLTKIVNRK